MYVCKQVCAPIWGGDLEGCFSTLKKEGEPPSQEERVWLQRRSATGMHHSISSHHIAPLHTTSNPQVTLHHTASHRSPTRCRLCSSGSVRARSASPLSACGVGVQRKCSVPCCPCLCCMQVSALCLPCAATRARARVCVCARACVWGNMQCLCVNVCAAASG